MSIKTPLSWTLGAVMVCLALSSCSNEPKKASAGTETAASGPASTPQPQIAEVRACDFLTVADAQQIMGAPMRIKPGDRAASVCMYEEVTARPNSIGPGTVSLTVNKRTSDGAENTDWARLKEVRHLAAGQKNVAALSGLGSEAWWTGHIEKGKTDVAAVIVRQGDSHFALDTMVIGYFASPDAMKNVARRIAGQMK